jgi:hypothetical protein
VTLPSVQGAREVSFVYGRSSSAQVLNHGI